MRTLRTRWAPPTTRPLTTKKAISAFTAAATLAPKNEDFAANLKKASAVAAGEEAHDAPMSAPEEKIELKKDEADARFAGTSSLPP